MHIKHHDNGISNFSVNKVYNYIDHLKQLIITDNQEFPACNTSFQFNRFSTAKVEKLDF